MKGGYIDRNNPEMTSWEGGEGALWNFIRAVAGRNDIPAEEVERDIEKAIEAVRMSTDRRQLTTKRRHTGGKKCRRHCAMR